MTNLSTQQAKAKQPGEQAPGSIPRKPSTPARRLSSKSGARLLAEARACLADPSIRTSRFGRLLAEMMQALDESINTAELAKAAKPQDKRAAGPGISRSKRANEKFLAEMRDQALKQRQRDIASEKLLSAAVIADRLGLTKQAVSAAVRAKRMFVLDGPSGEGFLPAFFADEKYDRAVLEKVSKALGTLPGGSKWEFFRTPRVSLGKKTPLELLAKGQIEPVLLAAAEFLDE
jgi:hypothetical protein